MELMDSQAASHPGLQQLGVAKTMHGQLLSLWGAALERASGCLQAALKWPQMYDKQQAQSATENG